jgi:branched-chain amino acid aminotransferase
MPPVPKELFVEAVHDAVSLNAEYLPPHETGAAVYIRPLLFGSSAQLGLNPPEEYTFCVYVMPTGVYHGTHPVKCLVLEDFDRAAPDGTGSAKVGGNYAPVIRWSDRARNEGYGITLHLDSKTRTEIDEFSTSGFIGIKKDGDSVTVVTPDSKNVIASVTSDSVQEIARSFRWKTEVRSVSNIMPPISSPCLALSLMSPIDQIRRTPLLHRNSCSRYSSSSGPDQVHHS